MKRVFNRWGIATLLAALTTLVVVGSAWVLAQDAKPQSENRAFMQVKLNRAQQVVEGLAMERFDLIEKSAQDLLLLSNESNWNVFQTPKYIDLSGEFRDAADRLRTAAREKNLDGATLAYFEVTLNCVRCHKYTRDVR